MPIRYLLDEHISPIYRKQLLRREPGLIVYMISDPGAPLKGTLDPEILRWCEDNGFVLVTNNRKSMPRHLEDHLTSGGHVPGILVIDMDMSIGEAVDDLVLVAGAFLEGEYRDSIIYLPLS
jgi:hypothetical protein